MTSVLLSKQQQFSKLIVKLISFAHLKGYEVTLGDAYRDPRVFGAIGERKGYGESKSAHKQRLALDINIFKDGQYLQNTSDHKELGEYWESLGGAWGGRFEDGNHYSLEHDGIK